MDESKIPHLCGGTFFTLVTFALSKGTAGRRRKGEKDSFRYEDVLFDLLLIYHPYADRAAAGTTFKTYASRFVKCEKANRIGEELKFENKNVLSAFQEELKTNYTKKLSDMNALCNKYLDLRETVKGTEVLVKRLIELLRDDTNIPKSTPFPIGKNGEEVPKSKLPSVDEVHLPAFLLGIWTYIVTERTDNTLGGATIKSWHSGPKAKNRYNGLMGDTIENEITVVIEPQESTPNEIKKDKVVPASELKPSSLFMLMDAIKSFNLAFEKSDKIIDIIKFPNLPIDTIDDAYIVDDGTADSVREIFCKRIDLILEANKKMQVKDSVPQSFFDKLESLYKGAKRFTTSYA